MSTKEGTYEFKPESLVDIRKRLKISQGEMARLLDVLPNTLSRWETGATAPDANSLAKIYSVAKEHGITPNFFSLRTETRGTRVRYRLIVLWDFQTLGVPSQQVDEAVSWIRTEVGRRFDRMTHRLFKAFTHPSQSAEADALEKLDWRVWEDDRDIDEEIIDQARSDSGQDPAGTVLILITRDRNFSDLIEELRIEGVRVYLLGPSSIGDDLIEKVGRRRWIQWEPTFVSLNYRYIP